MAASEWKYLRVEKLFHAFDYTLDFPQSPEPLILTGPNGYGKTTLLTIINALAEADYLYFWTLPFEEIELCYGCQQIIIRRRQDEGGQLYFLLQNLSSEDSPKACSHWISRKSLDLLAETIKGFDADNVGKMPKSLRAEANRILNGQPEMKPLAGVLSRMKVVFVPAERLRRLRLTPSEKDKLRSMTNKLHLAMARMERSNRNGGKIEDLLGLSEFDEGSPEEETILKLRRALQERMQQAKQDYNNQVAKSTQTLIDRILNDSSHRPFSQEEYAGRLARLQKKYELLLNFGLLDDFKVYEYNEANSSALRIILETVEENLKSFDELNSRLGIFLNWLEGNQYRGKTLSANPEQGLIATDKATGEEIPLERLSSGEKHEIILAYWLAFEVTDGSLVLIDEPELSLHVAWQTKFIPALRYIAERKHLVSIVATHAPFIINEQWDKTVDLELLDRKNNTER